MIVIIVYVILLGISSVCPFLLQIAGFVINTIYPDPIPFVDEIVMVLCMISKLEKIMCVFEFIADHKVAALIILLICIGVVLVGIYVYQNGGVPSFGR